MFQGCWSGILSVGNVGLHERRGAARTIAALVDVRAHDRACSHRIVSNREHRIVSKRSAHRSMYKRAGHSLKH